MAYPNTENHGTPAAAARDPAATRDFAGEAELSEELVRLLDEYLTELKAGRSPDRARLLADHPDLAGQLETCLVGLEFMARGSNAEAPRQLGGFRVLREVGRGGMGVVYEAEDLVLGRRVALKVLRFGVLCSPEAVERFEREAATVARLHHTNIVPIFSVGAEQGVHYFAMQFIEGRTLADAARNAPVDPRRAARWALQAAEALDHAHRHGVIHRDVKPSNLLLDGDDRIWLTDFGLARRLDDVTVSVTGALLGTPRYMSPEKASLVRSEIDHRTDVYSLGATLYELLSGAPAFAGDSPHQVIHAILTTDPEPPRRLRGDVPRDLDTIVMKCLEKSPARRYASARELADDLRAWLDGRAIRARQPSLGEQALRWLRQQRRGVLVAAGSIAATLVLTLLTMLAMNLHHRWQLGFLSLTTDQPRLAVELLDEQGQPTTAAVGVPTQQPLEVPAGEYTLRAHGPGRLRGTMRVDVPRGRKLKYDLNLDDQTLWPTLAIGRAVTLAPGQGRQDLLAMDEEGLKLIDGATGSTRWSCKLADGQKSLVPQAAGAVWPWDRAVGWRFPSGIGPFGLHPLVLAQAVDLNRDGFNDYVLAARHQAWLLAVSGADGQALWSAPRGADALEATPPASGGPRGVVSAVVAPTEKTADLDGDGVPDLLAVFADLGPRAFRHEARRWVEAVSGASGQAIWRYELESTWFHVDSEDDTPQGFRWFVGNSVGTASLGGWSASGQGIVRRSGEHVERLGEFVYVPQAPRIVDTGSEQRAVLIAGRHLIMLDATTGKPAAKAVELPYRPARPVQLIDVGGGLPAILAVEEIIDPARQAPTARVYSWSLDKQELVWQRELGAFFPRLPGFGSEHASWPLIADLNGDGRQEAIFPTDHSEIHEYGVPPWGALEACDAAIGQTIWQRRLLTMDQQIDHFLVGPDIDADGYRDLFAASIWGERFDLYIDALSGKDGANLWSQWQPPRRTDESPARFISRMRWWSEGPDRWPRLMVEAAPAQRSQGESSLLVVSAGSGEIVDEATQFEQFDLADLDGDGVDDLLRYYPKDQMQGDRGGTLDAFSGAAGERWRWLGQAWQPAADFDGDQIRDLVQVDLNGAVRALSGSHGRLLWTTNIRGVQSGQAPIQQAEQDLDRDGIADLLVCLTETTNTQTFAPLHAVSGKSGRVLWSADLAVRSIRRTALLTAHDLDGDGLPEIVFAALMDWGDQQRTASSNQSGRLWLVVLSGRQGLLRWKMPLTADGQFVNHELDGLAFAPALPDLNGDGVRDIVVPAQSGDDPQLVLRAVDGAAGEMLWEHPLPAALENYRPFRGAPPPLVADLDKDGTPEVYSLEFDGQDDGRGLRTKIARLQALNAADGKPRWTWQTDVAPKTGEIDSSEEEWKNRPRPQLLHSDSGDSLVCLNLWGDEGEVVALNAKGNEVYRSKVGYRHQGFRLATDDLTGDGAGELLFVNGPMLQAVEPTSGSIVWQQPLKNASGDSVLAVLAAERGPATVIVQQSPPESKVYGLAGATGKRLWTCIGPRPKTGGAWVNLAPAKVLSLEGGGQPPMLHFSYGSMGAGWRGRAIEKTGRRGGPSIARMPTMRADPRLVRPLPWAPPPHVSGAALTAVSIAVRTVFFSLALIVIPGAVAWWMISRRRWGLRTLALLPLVAALSVTALLTDAPEVGSSLVGKFINAAAASPAVLGLAIGIRWLAQGRWRPIAVSVALSVGLAVGIAGAALAMHRPKLAEGQYYSLDGWYLVWFIGAYLTAIALCAALVLSTVTRALWRRFRRKPSKAAAR